MCENKRFTGTTKRCPNSSYYIRDNEYNHKSNFKIFKNDELKNINVMNDIVECLNKLDDEVQLLKDDLGSVGGEYVNYDRLNRIREEYEKKLGVLKYENYKLKRKCEELENEVEELESSKKRCEELIRANLWRE